MFFVYVSAFLCEYTIEIALNSLDLLVTRLRFQISEEFKTSFHSLLLKRNNEHYWVRDVGTALW